MHGVMFNSDVQGRFVVGPLLGLYEAAQVQGIGAAPISLWATLFFRIDMTNKMHSVTWSADGVLTIDGAQDCLEVQPAEHDSELEILNEVVNRMSTILANISITLNGAEPALHRHSYHDLAEKVAVLQLEVDLYRHHAALPVRPAPESKAMTDTRDAFEAECRRYWGDRCPDLDFKDYKYESGRAEIAYAFWQAATLAEREKRQPLTDAQIHERYKAMRTNETRYIDIYRDAEAAHGIKA